MADMPAMEPGQIVDGKYRVEGILGRGGMGIVVAARHVMLGHQVALKVMLPGPDAASGEGVARFKREAHVVGMLKSQHAGKVRDAGTLAGGEPYIAMDLYEGQDLAQLVRARGALTVGDAVTYVLQAAEALAEAHGLGIVHRDVKPANLFLATNVIGKPHIKVLDFGVSKLREDDARLTQTGTSLGSPLYMAPELMLSAKHADGRADVWALGIVLYELLTEATPFSAETIPALSARVLRDAPTPITAYRRDLPVELVSTIMRCFEKDPARRWSGVSAFAAAIGPFAPAEVQHYVERVATAERFAAEPLQTPVHLAAARTRAPLDPALPAPRSAERAVERRRPGIVASLVITAIALVIGAIGFVIWPARRESTAVLPSATVPASAIAPVAVMPGRDSVAPTSSATATPLASSTGVAAAVPTSRPSGTIPSRSPSGKTPLFAPNAGLYDRGTKK